MLVAIDACGFITIGKGIIILGQEWYYGVAAIVTGIALLWYNTPPSKN